MNNKFIKRKRKLANNRDLRLSDPIKIEILNTDSESSISSKLNALLKVEITFNQLLLFA